MGYVQVFRLRGGGQVARTVLPRKTDLDAVYPERQRIVRTKTGTVWGDDDGRVLLILDERPAFTFAEDALQVLAFNRDSASIRVYTEIVSALVREGTPLADDNDDSGGENSGMVPVSAFVPEVPLLPEPVEPVYHILPVPPVLPGRDR